VINFSALTFLPLPHRLFSFGEITDTVTWMPFPFPELVSANISSLVVINILSFLFLAILPQDSTEGARLPEGRMAAAGPISVEDDLIIQAPSEHDYVGEVSRSAEIKIPEQVAAEQVGVLEEVLAARKAETAPAETLTEEQLAFLAQIGAAEEAPVASPAPSFFDEAPAAQVSSETLGSVYNAETSDAPASREQLEQLEQALLNNIDFKIEEALCISSTGEGLEDSIFHWHSADTSRVLKAFETYNKFAKATDMGELCQLVFKHGRDWYMISKYQGSYLVLKTAHTDPAPVLETTYRVLTAV